LAAVAGRGDDAGHEGRTAADTGTADHALAVGRHVEVEVPAHRVVGQFGELLERPHRCAIVAAADQGDAPLGQVVAAAADRCVVVDDAVPALHVGGGKVGDGDQLAGAEGQPDLVGAGLARQGQAAGDRLPGVAGGGGD